MEYGSNEEGGAAKWFYGAGLIAILFSAFLFNRDEYLSNSPRDRDLGKTIHELRLAQTSLGTESLVDPRLALGVGEVPSTKK